MYNVDRQFRGFRRAVPVCLNWRRCSSYRCKSTCWGRGSGFAIAASTGYFWRCLSRMLDASHAHFPKAAYAPRGIRVAAAPCSGSSLSRDFSRARGICCRSCIQTIGSGGRREGAVMYEGQIRPWLAGWLQAGCVTGTVLSCNIVDTSAVGASGLFFIVEPRPVVPRAVAGTRGRMSRPSRYRPAGHHVVARRHWPSLPCVIQVQTAHI